MKFIRYFTEKLSRKMMEKEIIKKEDVELYQYGMENGIILCGNLLTAVLIGIITGRLGFILVFLSFYAVLRSYSGGFHLESKLGCYLCSSLILFIPIYSYEWVSRNVPLEILLILGIAAVATVVVLSPVESIHKRLEPDEIEFYGGASRCLVGIQMCFVVSLYYIDLPLYSYAGYSSILLVAFFMILGKIMTKHYI